MLRGGEEPGRRRVLDDPAILHDDDPVGGLGHQAHVVADDHHAAADALLRRVQGLDDLALRDHVERAGRLVGDDDLRVQHHRDGDADPLLHASGELVGEEVGDGGGKADAGQRVVDAGLGLPGGEPDAMVGEAVQHLLAHPQHRAQRIHRALRDVGDSLQARGADRRAIQPDEIEIADPGGTRNDPPRRLQHPHQRQRCRGLARAGLADEADALAGGDREGDVAHGMDDLPRREEIDREIGDLQQGHVRPSGADADWRARPGRR